MVLDIETCTRDHGCPFSDCFDRFPDPGARSNREQTWPEVIEDMYVQRPALCGVYSGGLIGLLPTGVIGRLHRNLGQQSGFEGECGVDVQVSSCAISAL